MDWIQEEGRSSVNFAGKQHGSLTLARHFLNRQKSNEDGSFPQILGLSPHFFGVSVRTLHSVIRALHRPSQREDALIGGCPGESFWDSYAICLQLLRGGCKLPVFGG
jgi:hypothetical protein